jgi:hypothetical protein
MYSCSTQGLTLTPFTHRKIEYEQQLAWSRVMEATRSASRNRLSKVSQPHCSYLIMCFSDPSCVHSASTNTCLKPQFYYIETYADHSTHMARDSHDDQSSLVQSYLVISILQSSLRMHALALRQIHNFHANHTWLFPIEEQLRLIPSLYRDSQMLCQFGCSLLFPWFPWPPLPVIL